MPVICRIDEGRVPPGCHGLARRYLGSASEDNQAALLLYNSAYILQTRRSYIDIVSTISSDADLGSHDPTTGTFRSTSGLDHATPQAFREEQARIVESALLNPSPRFICATWTPASVKADTGTSAALCTINVKNQIELWLPKRPQGDAVYDVEVGAIHLRWREHAQKICDLSAAVLLGSSSRVRVDTTEQVHADDEAATSDDTNCLMYPGLSMCHFAQVPAEAYDKGFLGLVTTGKRLMALWLSNCESDNFVETGHPFPGDITAADEAVYDSADTYSSSDASYSAMPSKFENLTGDYKVFNQPCHRLPDFDIDRMKDLYPVPTAKTYRQRIEGQIIAITETEYVCSIATRLRESGLNYFVYDIIVATVDGNVKSSRICIDLDIVGPFECAFDPWRYLFKMARPPEMSRLRLFHGNTDDCCVLISLVHNSVVVYNIDGESYETQYCGKHPLVAYHTEPLYMRGGDLAQIVLVDAVGTRFIVVLNSELQLRMLTSMVPSGDFTTSFLDDTDTVRIEVRSNRSATEFHRSLRSPNIFAMTISLLSHSRPITHLTTLVEHLVHRNEMVYTNTMFARDRSVMEWSLSDITLAQFIELGSQHPEMEFWRELMRRVDNAELATDLYMIAYAEAGGDTEQDLTPIELRDDCKPLVFRLVAQLQVTSETIEQVRRLVTALYTKKQVTLLKS
ncbi:carbohydrate-active enzyme, putative [Babesia ovis]|uniref:Carbohydrate-active enzyme, putative n=1 Tax=Babesia ovis TaxID=5869 RepID=A0A9W5TE85_BABOV|nr:carbohydrate-active enzyme, putative [Babesia ovis]